MRDVRLNDCIRRILLIGALGYCFPLPWVYGGVFSKFAGYITPYTDKVGISVIIE